MTIEVGKTLTKENLMRKVIVSRREKENPHQLKEVGEALFHQFGVDFEEFETGAGNYSTAIIEWDNGRIEAVRVEQIRFIK